MAPFHEIVKRWPSLMALTLLLGLLYAGTADARTPTTPEWRAEARNEASRECNRRERNSPHIAETGKPFISCIRKGTWAPFASMCWRKSLANRAAVCQARFQFRYNWGRYQGFTRTVGGKVHMFYARDRTVRRNGHWVRIPVIGVNRPVQWIQIGWIGTQG